MHERFYKDFNIRHFPFFLREKLVGVRWGGVIPYLVYLGTYIVYVPCIWAIVPSLGMCVFVCVCVSVS